QVRRKAERGKIVIPDPGDQAGDISPADPRVPGEHHEGRTPGARLGGQVERERRSHIGAPRRERRVLRLLIPLGQREALHERTINRSVRFLREHADDLSPASPADSPPVITWPPYNDARAVPASGGFGATSWTAF